MKIPNINCKNYTRYGTCKVQKGWFFLKICPLSSDFSKYCEIQEKWDRPKNMPNPRPMCKPRKK